MALGGDPPTHPDAGEGELEHAIELVELARAVGGFSIGVAAQPAGHPASPDMASDRAFLAEKLLLADFGVTQFFFEADEYTALMDDLAARGVDRPVLPGIMPVTTLRSVPRMAQMGAAVPDWAVARLEEAAAGGETTRCAAPVWASPPSCASGCCRRERRGCTSTRSTARARPVRSTGRSACRPTRAEDPVRLQLHMAAATSPWGPTAPCRSPRSPSSPSSRVTAPGSTSGRHALSSTPLPPSTAAASPGRRCWRGRRPTRRPVTGCPTPRSRPSATT